MKIIAGNSNKNLAQGIAQHCFNDLVPSYIDTFSDGESKVEFLEKTFKKKYQDYPSKEDCLVSCK